MNTKWRIVKKNGYEYATCCGRKFKCITNQLYQKSGKVVAGWKWIPEIQRYVDYKCMY